jgi:integrase
LQPWGVVFVTTGVVQGVAQAALVKAGLPGIGFHILRHSCATIPLSPPISHAAAPNRG